MGPIEHHICTDGQLIGSASLFEAYLTQFRHTDEVPYPIEGFENEKAKVVRVDTYERGSKLLFGIESEKYGEQELALPMWVADKGYVFDKVPLHLPTIERAGLEGWMSALEKGQMDVMAFYDEYGVLQGFC